MARSRNNGAQDGGAMQGLHSAGPSGIPTVEAQYIGGAQADPLGVGVQTRGMQHALQASIDGDRGIGGPLPDPQWEGFYQAIGEHGGKLKGDGGEMTNSPMTNTPDTSAPLDNGTGADAFGRTGVTSPGAMPIPTSPLNNNIVGQANAFGQLADPRNSTPQAALQALKYKVAL